MAYSLKDLLEKNKINSLCCYALDPESLFPQQNGTFSHGKGRAVFDNIPQPQPIPMLFLRVWELLCSERDADGEENPFCEQQAIGGSLDLIHLVMWFYPSKLFLKN